MDDLERWMETHLKKGAHHPFSFTYNDQPSSSFLRNWQSDSVTKRLDDFRTKRTLTLKDPETGLKLSCESEVFADFPAVEWIIKLRNEGIEDTPILKDVNSLDVQLTRKEGGEFVLHHALGSDASRMDFAPLNTPLPPSKQLRLAPVGGRSSNTLAFPFFNIEAVGEGVMFGIGWSGQWAAEFLRDEGRSLRIRAGMEFLHLKLHEKEEIRTPRIMLLFWRGNDRMRGHNLLRRFLLAHHTPQKDGTPMLGPLACNGGSGMFDEANRATEENQIALAKRYRQYGLDTEYFWIDAGWFEGRWPNGVGNWFVRKDGFPKGLRPVSNALRAMGLGLILWFEPERVYRGTWIDRKHPDWVLRLPGNPNGLLDLGNPEARCWLTEHVSEMIESEGIDIYRQDFNMDPLPFWRRADETDRQGITEIRHIEGLYTFWDDLLSRHPGLIIDNCASGGRRIDLETTSRSIPLWRTDYQYFEPNGYQSHTYGLSLYLPCSGTGSGYQDAYSFRSSMNSALILGWDIYAQGFPVDQARRLIAEYKRIRHLFHGDFYPLTAHSTSDDVWISYQFHREDLGQGMFLTFRRPKSPYLTARLRLGGLNPQARYELHFEDTDERRTLTGEELSKGIDVTIEESPGSLLVTYNRLG